jgi:phage anti-repressor protein
MPNYNNIPILSDARLMMVEVEQIVKDFHLYHKYTLGAELRKKAMQIYQLVSRAIQHKQNRKRWIESLIYAVDDFKCQIQIAKELEIFKNFKQFELLARYSLALKKQSKSWQQKMVTS